MQTEETVTAIAEWGEKSPARGGHLLCPLVTGPPPFLPDLT